VELTAERWDHIAERYPELLHDQEACIGAALAAPGSERRNDRSANTRLFTRWFPDLRGGKHGVVIVTSDYGRDGIVTAFITRRLPLEAALEWMRN
jgi:hypothetical protein